MPLDPSYFEVLLRQQGGQLFDEKGKHKGFLFEVLVAAGSAPMTRSQFTLRKQQRPHFQFFDV